MFYVGNRDRVFFGLSFGLDGALLTKNVQASLQGMFLVTFFLDLYFLDNMLGVPEGALVAIVLIALLMLILKAIITFLPCPSF